MLATRDGIKGVCCSFSFFEPASWKLRAVHATETVIRRGGSRLREGYARGRASSLRRREQKGRGGMQDGDRGTKGPCKSSTSVTPAVPAPERRARALAARVIFRLRGDCLFSLMKQREMVVSREISWKTV